MTITKNTPLLIGIFSSLLFNTSSFAEQSSETINTRDEIKKYDPINTDSISAITAEPDITIRTDPSLKITEEQRQTDTDINKIIVGKFTETLDNDIPLTDPSILIVDASKSMLNTIHNIKKISIEKIIVEETALTWSNVSPLGIIAYGNSCNDINLLHPISIVNDKLLKNQIRQINASGESPYIAAVQKAAQLLDHTNKKATIILISDGLDSCNSDPCTAVKLLKNSSKNITAHVIDFDAKEGETEGLRCLAHETGGIYVKVTTPQELKIALNEVKQIVTTKQPLKITEASVSVNVEEKIIAGSTFNVDWEGPENSTDKLIIKSEKHNTTFDYQYLGNAIRVSPSEMIAPEILGIYEIHYQLENGKSLAKTSIEVIPAKATINVNKQMMANSQLQVNWIGPRNKYDKIVIINLETNELYDSTYTYRQHDKSPSLFVTPEKLGEYEIQYLTANNRILTKAPLNVVTAIIDSPDKVVSGSEFKINWVGPSKKLDTLIIVDDNNRELASAPVFRIQDVSPTKLTAPGKPGEYQIRYTTKDNQILARQTFTVTPATATINTKKEIIAGAQFDVEWTGPDNASDMIALYDSTTNKRLSFTYFSGINVISPATLTAPEKPGNYEIRYLSNFHPLDSQSIVVIPAIATLNAALEVPIGYKFYVNWSGPKNKDDVIGVFKPKNNRRYNFTYISNKESDTSIVLTAPLTPGEYEVRYVTAGGNTLASHMFNATEIIEDKENNSAEIPAQ